MSVTPEEVLGLDLYAYLSDTDNLTKSWQLLRDDETERYRILNTAPSSDKVKNLGPHRLLTKTLLRSLSKPLSESNYKTQSKTECSIPRGALSSLSISNEDYESIADAYVAIASRVISEVKSIYQEDDTQVPVQRKLYVLQAAVDAFRVKGQDLRVDLRKSLDTYLSQRDTPINHTLTENDRKVLDGEGGDKITYAIDMARRFATASKGYSILDAISRIEASQAEVLESLIQCHQHDYPDWCGRERNRLADLRKRQRETREALHGIEAGIAILTVSLIWHLSMTPTESKGLQRLGEKAWELKDQPELEELERFESIQLQVERLLTDGAEDTQTMPEILMIDGPPSVSPPTSTPGKKKRKGKKKKKKGNSSQGQDPSETSQAGTKSVSDDKTDVFSIEQDEEWTAATEAGESEHTDPTNRYSVLTPDGLVAYNGYMKEKIQQAKRAELSLRQIQKNSQRIERAMREQDERDKKRRERRAQSSQRSKPRSQTSTKVTNITNESPALKRLREGWNDAPVAHWKMIKGQLRLVTGGEDHMAFIRQPRVDLSDVMKAQQPQESSGGASLDTAVRPEKTTDSAVRSFLEVSRRRLLDLFKPVQGEKWFSSRGAGARKRRRRHRQKDHTSEWETGRRILEQSEDPEHTAQTVATESIRDILSLPSETMTEHVGEFFEAADEAYTYTLKRPKSACQVLNDAEDRTDAQDWWESVVKANLETMHRSGRDAGLSSKWRPFSKSDPYLDRPTVEQAA